ncbi:MAG: TolC family protein [Chitinophagales bacterium]|nr:TolC family protein [Chitinophagales bacterium]
MGLIAQSNDSLRILTQNDFFALIRQNHPLAKQAYLLDEVAAATLQAAKGNFDPQTFAYFNNKNFTNKNYYSLLQSGIKIPLYPGLDLKVGYDYANGYQLNPENKLPEQGQASVGVSVPLWQGLRIDPRRAALQQAKVFAQSSRNEQKIWLNELFFNAAIDYWQWTKNYNELLIAQKALQLATQRFEWIKSNYRLGDIAAIDTLEALLQVQTRQFELNQVQNQYRNAAVILDSYLWDENGRGRNISQEVQPYRTQFVVTQPPIDNNPPPVDEQHPQLQLYRFKLQNLAIDRRWKIEKLKPKLNLNYNLLGNSWLPIGNETIPIVDNYKIGVEWNMPLFRRTAKAELKLADIKIQQTQLDLQQKQQELQAKLNVYYNEWRNNEQQIQLYQQMTQNYSRLLTAEETEFRGGESNLFIVNSRENKLVEAQNKLIDLQVKQQIIRNTILYLRNTLAD